MADRYVVGKQARRDLGRFKAVFFESLGYSVDAWQQLEADLRAHAVLGEARVGNQTKYGQKLRGAWYAQGAIR